MSKKAEQSQVTASSLVRAARELFAEHGYAATSTTAVAERAGMTRGALYHQFAGKEALFRAVYEDVEREVTERVLAALPGATDELDAMLRGADAFLDACLDPAVRRIVLVEGPSVLGWATTREILQAYGLGLMRASVQSLLDARLIEPQDLDPLAHMLLGGLTEAGLMLAHADDPDAERPRVGVAVRTILGSLVGRR